LYYIELQKNVILTVKHRTTILSNKEQFNLKKFFLKKAIHGKGRVGGSEYAFVKTVVWKLWLDVAY